MFGPNTYQDAFQMGDTKELLYHLTLQVAAGEYAVNAALFGATDQEKIAIIPEGPTLIVDPGDGLPKAGGLAYLPHCWESKKGTA